MTTLTLTIILLTIYFPLRIYVDYLAKRRTEKELKALIQTSIQEWEQKCREEIKQAGKQ